MKKFVIGDIHGAYKELMQCLQKSEIDYKNDILITLGDIADGWSDVIDCVLELKKIENLIPIQGNHDAWYLDFLKYGITRPEWISQGGLVTYNDYYKNKDKIGHDELTTFFNRQSLFYIDHNNNLFVHGGFPKYSKFKNGKYIGIPSNLMWDRTLIEAAKIKTISIAYKDMKLWFDDFNEIYVGHTPIKPELFKKYQNVWPMDTGAGGRGVLTIMNIDTKEYWCSDIINRNRI